MDIAFITNSVSPHQLPFCSEMAKKLDSGVVTYIYTESIGEDRRKLGWDEKCAATGVKISHISALQDGQELQSCQFLIADIRDIPLFQKRADKGLGTLYVSERWFKPPLGILRLLHTKYFLMAWRFVRLLRNSDKVIYLPQGIHAAHDMARLCGLFAGDLRCLFRAPKLDFEQKPGGKIWLKGNRVEHVERLEKRYCLIKMRIWGYFVAPSTLKLQTPTPNFIRVLWVGRFLKLKRVDTIIRAVGELSACSTCSTRFTLGIYGTGSEESRLKQLASKYGDAIKFYPPVPINEVRKLMREHDVYVLASNAYEGWGAVVSEALEEGMKVVGTYEAGSCATVLPKECLFHAGDHVALMKLLKNANELPFVNKVTWSARNAADAMIDMLGFGL